MTSTRLYGILVVLLAATALVARGQEDFQWQEVRPEAEGLSSRKLDEATEALSRRGTKTFLVIRSDKIVHEWYARQGSNVTCSIRSSRPFRPPEATRRLERASKA